jgi:hypothetical protein
LQINVANLKLWRSYNRNLRACQVISEGLNRKRELAGA